MYIILDNILLNPLQIESAQYVESRLLINEHQSGGKINIIMSSGAKYELNHENCNDVLKAMQELVFQIDLACGMRFEPKAEADDNEEERDARKAGKE